MSKDLHKTHETSTAKFIHNVHEFVQYMDDCFLKGVTYAQCQQNLFDTVQLLQDMGFGYCILKNLSLHLFKKLHFWVL